MNDPLAWKQTLGYLLLFLPIVFVENIDIGLD